MERDPRFSRYVQQDIFGAPLAGLFGHRTKLGQWLAIVIIDIGEVTQGVNAAETRHREVGLNIDASAVASCNPQVL